MRVWHDGTLNEQIKLESSTASSAGSLPRTSGRAGCRARAASSSQISFALLDQEPQQTSEKSASGKACAKCSGSHIPRAGRCAAAPARAASTAESAPPESGELRQGDRGALPHSS